MANFYYVKANRQEWEYPRYSKNPTDWDNFPLKKEQDFSTFTRNQLYWKNLKVGDRIIGHSSYISSNIKGKIKYTPLPRISAIAVVTAIEHYSDDLESDAVTLRKEIELTPIRITKKLLEKYKLINFKDDKKSAEPFRLGTNRCTITKLNIEEFNKIINLIQEEGNPNIKNGLKRI